MNIWLFMLLAGLVTFLIRLSFIFLSGRIAMPEWFKRALRFVPAAVLSAITLPELLRPQGDLAISIHNPQAIAGLVAILVAWRTRSMLWTIGSGMVVYLLLWMFK
jgi:branched-subunit amino acid transport protein